MVSLRSSLSWLKIARLLFEKSSQPRFVRWVHDKSSNDLFKPVEVKIDTSRVISDVGSELSGKLSKVQMIKLLNSFYRLNDIRELAGENGLDARMFQEAFVSFRKYCLQAPVLPADLHIVFSDISNNAGHITDIFPYFLRHARDVFPHLVCLDDLREISDLREPPNWYPNARSLFRKVVYHCGPTNSGKTHHALQSFMSAAAAVYCGPLKLLASEVFMKANKLGTPCDLVTGEERRYADPDGKASNHISCTVEMANLTTKYDVGVIDEIQMMRDQQRGWAWTRAFLGLYADEIHVCGEASAVDLVQELTFACGDDFEVHNYKRLTKLIYLDKALESFENTQTGDCFVCFSKKDIFTVTRELERLGLESAVIYGSLPPGTKLAQAHRFNDPEDSCSVMVATDAIGMGLNFLMKPQLNENGEKEIDFISTSQALQIAGRAGRFKSQFECGEVTTFRSEDLNILRNILSKEIEPIERAGLHPTADQLELFAYHLPNHSLSKLLDIFIALCRLNDSHYFLCNVDDLKFLADLIDHVPLDLRSRYVFCCAPINRKVPFVCTIFLKFARMYSLGYPVTQEWLVKQIGWPFKPPNSINDLIYLEAVYDVLDLYLWLGLRFIDIFGGDSEIIKDMQKELDAIIEKGVCDIVQLLRHSSRISVDETELTDLINQQSSRTRLKRFSPVNDVNGFALPSKEDKKAPGAGAVVNSYISSVRRHAKPARSKYISSSPRYGDDRFWQNSHVNDSEPI